VLSPGAPVLSILAPMRCRFGCRVTGWAMRSWQRRDEVSLEDLQQMVRGARAMAERLTYTFRFRDGSAELDPQSLSNVDFLARRAGGRDL
jgi:hypothetical protein